MNRDADKHFAALNERLRLAREAKIRQEEQERAWRRQQALMPSAVPVLILEYGQVVAL